MLLWLKSIFSSPKCWFNLCFYILFSNVNSVFEFYSMALFFSLPYIFEFYMIFKDCIPPWYIYSLNRPGVINKFFLTEQHLSSIFEANCGMSLKNKYRIFGKVGFWQLFWIKYLYRKDQVRMLANQF